MHIAHLSFRHFLTLLALFPPFFPHPLKLSLPASNKCILPVFLSVTFLALLSLFPPFFSHLNIVSHASNKCVLHIYLSVTFLTLPTFTCITLLVSNKCLLPIFLSGTFLTLPAFTYIYSLPVLINAYCPSFFPSLPSPFSPFFRQFLRHI
jgi:hypothetical protein